MSEKVSKKAGRDTRGHFAKGNPGKAKGTRNVKTIIGAELFAALHEGGDGLPSAWERWKRLLDDPDAHVRLKAEEIVAERCFGRTRQELEGGGDLTIKIVNTSWSVEPRFTETRESK
jgi:hypothetical protein